MAVVLSQCEDERRLDAAWSVFILQETDTAWLPPTQQLEGTSFTVIHIDEIISVTGADETDKFPNDH